MSFLNIGADGPPNHTLEIEGDMFVSNVEQGTITNFVPVDIQGNLRLRNKPPGFATDEYRVSDMKLNSTLFGIAGPSSDASRSTTDFCIDRFGNVGIGTTPTTKLNIQGSMYATGSLTNESNLITGTLTSTGTLTCNVLAHGENSNIYGLLPTGTILMSTNTATISGWTDITSQFSSKNVLLAENATNLTTGGNDTFTINSNYDHNHDWSTTHTVNHNHNFNSGNMNAGGDHTHSKPNTNLNSGAMGSHNHNYSDRSGAGDRGEANYNSNRVQVNWGISPNSSSYRSVNTQDALHSHTGGNYGFNSKNMNHGHNGPNITANENNGGTHTHNFVPSGSTSVNAGNPFSILPISFGLRFIKKN